MRLILAISLGIICLSLGCGDGDELYVAEPPPTCTEVACSSGFTLELVPIDERFQKGEYEVRLSPLLAEGAFICSFTVDDTSVEFGICEMVIEPHGSTTGITLDYLVLGSPLNIVVYRDTAEVASDEVTPDYDIYYPNGKDCPGWCVYYDHDLIVE